MESDTVYGPERGYEGSICWTLIAFVSSAKWYRRLIHRQTDDTVLQGLTGVEVKAYCTRISSLS